MPLLGREPGTHVFRDLDENPDDETFPGIVVLRLDGGLFFATAEALEDRVRELLEDGPAAARSCSTSRASTSSTPRASAKLAEIHRLAQPTGRRSASPGSSRRSAPCCEADGVVDLIGADHIHGNVHRAVEAQLAS